MNSSKNKKFTIRIKNKKRFIMAQMVLFLIGVSIGSLMISGIIHIIGCRCVEATEATPAAISCEEAMMSCEEYEKVSLGKYKLTAYCACKKCCGKTDGITASGVKAVEGVTVAADTRVLPFGTKIIIDDHEYIVQDRGGAIKGNRIDVYFDSHYDALKFGVQYKEIFTMKEGEMI